MRELNVDDSLQALPLLELAADVARHFGKLVVACESLPPLTGGGLFGRRIGGAVIVLDLATMARPLEDVWAHELGHAIDTVWHGHLSADREVFADALGALLLVERPASLTEAVPLVLLSRSMLDRCPLLATATCLLS